MLPDRVSSLGPQSGVNMLKGTVPFWKVKWSHCGRWPERKASVCRHNHGSGYRSCPVQLGTSCEGRLGRFCFSGCLLPLALLKMLGILTSDEQSTGISRTVCDHAHLLIWHKSSLCLVGVHQMKVRTQLWTGQPLSSRISHIQSYCQNLRLPASYLGLHLSNSYQ